MTNRATRRRMMAQNTPSGRRLTRWERQRYCEYLKIREGFVEPRMAPKRRDKK